MSLPLWLAQVAGWLEQGRVDKDLLLCPRLDSRTDYCGLCVAALQHG